MKVMSSARFAALVGELRALRIRFRASVRRHGVFGTLTRGLRRVIEACSYSECVVSIVALPVATARPRYARRSGPYRVIELSADSISRYCAVGTGEAATRLRRHNTLQRWLNEGDVGFAALNGDIIIGFLSLMHVRYTDDWGLKLDLAKGECKIRFMYVEARFRRSVVAGLLHDAALECARQRGFEILLGSIERRNAASLKNAIIGGYREVRRIRCRRVFYWCRWARDIWKAPSPAHGRTLRSDA